MRKAVVAGLVLAIAGTAHADPDDLVGRRLVLDRARFAAELTLEIGLQDPGGPISLAPSLWYGLTERWTVGVIHGNRSLDRIDAGASFCVGHDDLTCTRTYRGSGLDVRWSWLDGPFAVAPRVRAMVRDLGPTKPVATLGALIRWTRGRYAITSDPYLRIGLANRDLGNRDALVVPVWLAIQPTCRWMIALHTGWDSDLAVFRDGWHVPLALAVRVNADRDVDVELEGGFSSLLGPQNNVKQAAILATLAWRQ